VELSAAQLNFRPCWKYAHHRGSSHGQCPTINASYLIISEAWLYAAHRREGYGEDLDDFERIFVEENSCVAIC
jgi:hypothetical protein